MGLQEQITVEVDEETLAALERMATANGRDIVSEVRDIIRRNVRTDPPMTPEEFLARARAIRAMTPAGVVQSDSTLLIREDRDR